jgi:asparagine synthase (glutamine-hydrolysing)
MCGICGLASWDANAVPLDDETLRSMTDVIAHRGPDDDGAYRAPGAALGMRRLSIIDGPGSAQPIANEDGTVRTVFNGEIYNFRQLRDELGRKGHSFSTRGDGETIVHLYEEHGLDFAKHLRGMFAIAVWDEPRRRLVLARDRMGVKPLYYTVGEWGLAFASEVKSLIVAGLVDPELDLDAAELFMAYGYVPGPATLFAGVRKLAPASVLFWEQDEPRIEQYWSAWDHLPDGAGDDWESDQESLLELLRQAVRARMVSDVPLGVMLSGGLDSSLITALMTEASTGPVKTFSIGFAEDAKANELGDARRVADRLGTEHHDLTTSAVDHPELLDEALWHMEEPIADISCLGFLLLSRLARTHVTVALSGQGADELLGGYRKHQVAAVAGRLAAGPAPLRHALAMPAGLLRPESTAARGLVALTTGDPSERLLAMSRIVQPAERSKFFTTEFLRRDAEARIADEILDRLPPGRTTILSETLSVDTRMALVDSMFLYFDKMSMAASLEVRVPFMDHDVVAFCTGLPDSRRVWGLRRKELLKRLSGGLLDQRVIHKRKQGFFRSALGAWLRVNGKAVFDECLLDQRATGRGLYRMDTVRELVTTAGSEGAKADQRLFTLLMLEKWQRFYVDADGPGRRVHKPDG